MRGFGKVHISWVRGKHYMWGAGRYVGYGGDPEGQRPLYVYCTRRKLGAFVDYTCICILFTSYQIVNYICLLDILKNINSSPKY